MTVDPIVFEEIMRLKMRAHHAEATTAILVTALYQLLLDKGVASRDEVHQHLIQLAGDVASDPNAHYANRSVDTLARVFDPKRSENPRPALHVIQGGLSGSPPDTDESTL